MKRLLTLLDSAAVLLILLCFSCRKSDKVMQHSPKDTPVVNKYYSDWLDVTYSSQRYDFFRPAGGASTKSRDTKKKEIPVEKPILQYW